MSMLECAALLMFANWLTESEAAHSLKEQRSETYSTIVMY
jgi:hypothetical protein